MSAQDKPRRRRRDERKEETRAELIAAAAQVFARCGFHGASVEQIAVEAGYSTGAIYWHFASKEDLFLAVYEAEAATRARDFTASQQWANGDLPERARALADQFMARQLAEPEFVILSLEFLAHAWRNPELRDAFGHRLVWGRLAVARVLEEEAEAAGMRLPMPAQDLAAIFRELGTGLALAKLADPDAFSEELFGDFIALFFERVQQRDPGIGNAGRRHPGQAR